MKLSSIFLATTTASSSSWLDASDIVGYVLAVLGIFAT